MKFLGNKITRLDGKFWANENYAVGQIAVLDGKTIGTVTQLLGNVMTVGGVSFGLLATTRWATVSIFTPGADMVRNGGNIITVKGGAGAGPGDTLPTLTETFTVSAGNVVESAGTYWHNAGFEYGQVVRIGLQALWTVSRVDGKKLTLSGPAIPIGGLTATLSGFASSPLVVYGGTSQDGVWYSGDTGVLSSRDFGSKPYPNTLGNGTPRFVFPVANPFRYFGNNVIDASQLYANAWAANVPAFGLTIYGGAGSDTIIGSRTRDFLFGGGGPDTITNADAAIGDIADQNAGVNADVITRALSFPTWNQSSWPNADRLSETLGLIPVIMGLPPALFAIINGIVPLVPTIPPITVLAGTTPPPVPYIELDSRDVSSSSQNEWVTTNHNPRFTVIPALLTAVPYFADGKLGSNVKIYLNGVLYTQEPLAVGTYTVQVTYTDYYGMTSALATATRTLRVENGPPPAGGGGLLDIFGNLLGTGDLLGIVQEVAQITVPGQFGTTDLPYATELEPWINPVDILLQSATSQLTSELLNVITPTGIPAPSLVYLAGGFMSPIDLDPLTTLLLDALTSFEPGIAFPGLPIAPPAAPAVVPPLFIELPSLAFLELLGFSPLAPTAAPPAINLPELLLPLGLSQL